MMKTTKQLLVIVIAAMVTGLATAMAVMPHHHHQGTFCVADDHCCEHEAQQDSNNEDHCVAKTQFVQHNEKNNTNNYQLDATLLADCRIEIPVTDVIPNLHGYVTLCTRSSNQATHGLRAPPTILNY
jgi:flagellar basal body-associated protein FliL